MSMRHFQCPRCEVLVFTEREDSTRCSNCYMREEADKPLTLVERIELADQVIEEEGSLVGRVIFLDL